MPYTYPKASKSILEGNEIYRLNRSAFQGDKDTVFGSLIPLDVGFNAIVVGPNSDYDNYELFYPDPLAPSGIAQANFSTGAPFVGAVAPNASGVYEKTKGVSNIAYIKPTKALILNPDDLGGNLTIPCMDIIAYTGRLPVELPGERSVRRKEGYFKTGPDAAKGGHAIPGFGRKSFTANILNNLAKNLDVVVSGVMVGNGPMVSEPIGVAEKSILVASTVVAAGASFTYPHNAPTDGYFDYYLVEVSHTAPDNLPSDGVATAVFISLEVQD